MQAQDDNIIADGETQLVQIASSEDAKSKSKADKKTKEESAESSSESEDEEWREYWIWKYSHDLMVDIYLRLRS